MFAPDDFRNNPYGHLTNQSGHAMVGIGMGLLAYPLLPPVAAWLAVVVVYFVAWEVIIGSSIKDGDIAPSWDWRDSIDDTSNVGGGAAVLIGALAYGYWGALVGFLMWFAAVLA